MNPSDARHCSGCGAELGLQLESTLQGRPCSGCQTPLEAFVEAMGTRLVCRGCGGQFVEHALLRHLLHEQERLGHAFPDAPYRKPPAKPSVERVRYRPCPVCDQLMNRKNFGGASGVIVDVCARDGSWFDHGELSQVLAFVQGGGLIREQARAEQRLRELRARERDHNAGGDASSPLAFDSLAQSSAPASFAKDLLAFVVDVLTNHSSKRG